MGLLESLYEKYDCQDPPQVDMISVLVSGVASPALSQYFAQDIQEMVCTAPINDGIAIYSTYSDVDVTLLIRVSCV